MSALRQTPEQNQSKGEWSTAARFYDMEESQKRYRELVEQNIWLKQQIEKNKFQQNTSNEYCCPTCPKCTVCTCQDSCQEQSSPQSDFILWNMLERNRYLEEKIDKLKGQYEKQSKTLYSIKSSDKWKNRFVCHPLGNNCYQQKYLQLLRVRSPFY